ncbi:hypothetical protein FOFC_20706, partial [Fusarium oxysporum]
SLPEDKGSLRLRASQFVTAHDVKNFVEGIRDETGQYRANQGFGPPRQTRHRYN